MNNYLAVIKTAGSRALIIGEKYLPEILLTTGIVTGAVGVFFACKGTLKAQYIVAEHQQNIQTIGQATKLAPEKYSSEERRKDLVTVYSNTSFELIKAYGPAVTLGVASLILILSSRNIMSKRNIALVAAYKAVEKGFGDYRKRVVEELGTDKDFQFRHGVEKIKVDGTITDPETGKTKKVKKELKVVDPNNISQYSRFFDDTNDMWVSDANYNKQFLICQQNFANDRLHATGHLFLNDVYKQLGFKDTKEGAIVGWVVEEGNDNYVDFGIFDVDRRSNREFVNGYESAILLDFNVDGVVFDKI